MASRKTQPAFHDPFAQTVVLESEDTQAFARLRADLRASYQPAGTHEVNLVEQVVAAQWRLMRARRKEKELLDRNTSFASDSFKAYLRYEASASRDYHRSLADLDRAQERRRRDERHWEKMYRRPAQRPETSTERDAMSSYISAPDPSTIAMRAPVPPPARVPPVKQNGFVAAHAVEATRSATLQPPASLRKDESRLLPEPRTPQLAKAG